MVTTYRNTQADRIRFNMGQQPTISVVFLQATVRYLYNLIAAECENARKRVYWRYPYRLTVEERTDYEYDLQQLELLLAEIELAFHWRMFDFQQAA